MERLVCTEVAAAHDVSKDYVQTFVFDIISFFLALVADDRASHIENEREMSRCSNF
jgi:hypothetical protein